MDILGRLPRPCGHLLDIACAVILEDACVARSGLDRASPPPRPRADMRGPCLHTGSGLYVGHAARSRLGGGGACARRVASGRYDLPEGYRTDGGSILQGFRLHAQTHREIAPGPEGALWGSDALQTPWGLPPSGTASRAPTPSYACAPVTCARPGDRDLVRRGTPTDPGAPAG